MAATTDQKARLLDLTTGVLELVRDGNRSIGDVCDVLQSIKDDPNFAARLLVKGGVPVFAPKSALLEVLGTLVLSATTKRFIAWEKFVVSAESHAPIKFSWIGRNFKEWFLGKTEGPVAETTLSYAKLLKSSIDSSILTELGNTVEVMLVQIFALLVGQPNGESGVLLTNGRANIFYVWNVIGVLRVVDVHWNDDGWLVSAYSIEHPTRWHDGCQVFSCCNSLEVQTV